MEIDESTNGVDRGLFCWKVGDGECEVLERFMQECEFSNGVWNGVSIAGEALGQEAEVQWGWSVDQLAEWLCRIVVGEVVREEEMKAKAKAVKKGGK